MNDYDFVMATQLAWLEDNVMHREIIADGRAVILVICAKSNWRSVPAYPYCSDLADNWGHCAVRPY